MAITSSSMYAGDAQFSDESRWNSSSAILTLGLLACCQLCTQLSLRLRLLLPLRLHPLHLLLQLVHLLSQRCLELLRQEAAT